MFATKNPIVVLVLLFISCISYAQTVKVTEDNERIKGRNGNGYRIDLEASKAEVLTALPKFLRSVGRIRQDDDQFTVSNPSINGITYNGSLYAVARGDEKSARAWFGFLPNEWSEGAADSLSSELKKLTYDFGIVFYRDKIQAQIDESMRALQAVERQQQRLATQQKELTIKMDDNVREKAQLEKSLENNRFENAVLNARLERTATSIDSLTLVNEKIKSVIESQKKKQEGVK